MPYYFDQQIVTDLIIKKGREVPEYFLPELYDRPFDCPICGEIAAFSYDEATAEFKCQHCHSGDIYDLISMTYGEDWPFFETFQQICDYLGLFDMEYPK